MTRQPRYHWFQGATIKALCDQLTPNAILEVHQSGDEMFLLVVPPDAEAAKLEANLLNESHPCPPFCRE